MTSSQQLDHKAEWTYSFTWTTSYGQYFDNHVDTIADRASRREPPWVEGGGEEAEPRILRRPLRYQVLNSGFSFARSPNALPPRRSVWLALLKNEDKRFALKRVFSGSITDIFKASFIVAGWRTFSLMGEWGQS